MQERKYRFKSFAQVMREDAERDFENVLARLPGWVGHRHQRLPLVVRKGRQAAHTDAEIYDAILANCGEPRLDESEVRQALSVPTQPGAAEHRPAPENFATERERSFVVNSIAAGVGGTLERLQSAAGLPPTATDRHAALRRHIAALTSGDVTRRDIFFHVGEKDEVNLLSPAEICAFDGEAIWPRVSANGFSGRLAQRKNGRGWTRRGDGCVAEPRLVVVEFDEMGLDTQFQFWTGVLRTGSLSVASIVYSGGKSLHGLVVVEGGDYAAFRDRIRRLCCSAEVPEYRADRAVLHRSALTRLAGAIRPETGRLQELAWVDTR